MNSFSNSTLLITGGTGSFGTTVLKHFLHTDIGQIRFFSRDEKKQDDMRHDFQAHHGDAASKVKFYIGDVRDPRSVRDAMDGVDYIFNAAIEAGVNRPDDQSEFMSGNYGFASTLLDALKRHDNRCPVMLSSSIQASLSGRFGDSEYGRSKLAGEELFFDYGDETGAKVLVYRFPNLFGKWCRPNYNSVVATFCNAFANHLPYTVNDPSVELELLYIDDLVDEMLSALKGQEHRCVYSGTFLSEKTDGKYCYVPLTYRVTLGRIVELLKEFSLQPSSLLFTSVPEGSFEKKLYSTYLSYLPEESTIFDLKGAVDERGSFTEFFRNKDVGQFSINVSKPGKTKGQHWHHTKMEIFLVVSGHGLIQERRIGM